MHGSGGAERTEAPCNHPAAGPTRSPPCQVAGWKPRNTCGCTHAQAATPSSTAGRRRFSASAAAAARPTRVSPPAARAASVQAAAAVASCLLLLGAACERLPRFVKGRWTACRLRRGGRSEGKVGRRRAVQAIPPNAAHAASPRSVHYMGFSPRWRDQRPAECGTAELRGQL